MPKRVLITGWFKRFFTRRSKTAPDKRRLEPSSRRKVEERDIVSAHEKFVRGYRDLKSGREFELHLRKCGLPSFDKLVASFRVPVVNVLDVGAGEGSLGDYLQRKFGKRINYFGIDLKRSKRVRKHNIVKDRLPRESFDLIVSFFTFPYLTDKFKALENIINALSVNGVAVIPDFGYFELDGKRMSNYSTSGRQTIMRLLANPNLDVIVRPEGGILIRKKASFVFSLQIKFQGATPSKPTLYSESVKQRKVSFESHSLVSCYTTD